jgi:large repetitive protein
VILGASPELSELATALGLLDASGNLDATWFSDPLTRVEGALRTASQRQALLRFFARALPPVPQPGVPAAEKWHPLLDAQTNGNLYLTLRDTGSGIVIGLAGDFHSSVGAPVPGRIRTQIDIIRATTTVDLVAGTAAHPLVVEVRVDTAWPFDPPGGHPVGLGAIVGRAEIVPDPAAPSARLFVTLEGLSLGGEPAIDKVLDVAHLDRDVPDVLAALLKIVLAEGAADPTIAMLADHLLALVGLADAENIPAFPFAELGDGPVALQRWLNALSGSDGITPPTVGPWLEHLAGLLGTAGVFSGTGDPGNPWRARLLAIPGGGELFVSVARIDGRLRVGFGGSIGGALGPGDPELTVDAAAAIADIPLGGTDSARVLSEASLALRLTGTAGGSLVNDPSVRIGALVAGVIYDGAQLKPSLLLLDNALAGTPYPRLDLTNTDSVAGAATALVIAAIEQALGTGAGRRIAALVGIVAPEDPANPGTPVPGWPHQLDLTAFVVNPPAAIAAYHRAVLNDGDRWSLLVRELSALVGLGAIVDGTGTVAQPWSVTIGGGAGDPALQLAAWHGPSPDAPTTEQLRIGLRLMAAPAGAELSWTSEVLAVDLPAGGPANVQFIGEQRLRVAVSPAADTSNEHLDVHLDSIEATAVWSPTTDLEWRMRAQGLTLTAEGDSMHIVELRLPPATGFDLNDLPATAASLGLGVGDLEAALRCLLSLFASFAGPAERVATALLGIHHRLSGLSEDTPTIVDPAQPGLSLRDPLGALRGWIARVIAHIGTAGEPTAAVLLEWLAASTSGALPDDIKHEAPPDVLVGAGTFADPWRVSWPGAPDAGGPDLDLWLEPEGPPTTWVAGLVTQAQAATDLSELASIVERVSWFDAPLRSLVGGLSERDITERLLALQTHFSAGDGVVDADSQGPDVFGWLHGEDVNAAHQRLPAHADAIARTLAQVESLVAIGPTARTVLLIGPSFTDRSIWADLLASPQRQGPTDPGAHFELRTPGIDPLTISLDSVTAVADWYTAHLADDGRGDAAFMAGQIAHVAERLAVLHPGPLVIVAHSYAGLAARRFAAEHASRVLGLITIGTPHLGAPLAFLSGVELGDAVRVAGTMRANMPASVLRDALDHLLAAVDGYTPPAQPGQLATPNPYPSRSFGMAAPFDVGDIPVLTLRGIIADDVFAWLQAAVVAHAQAVAAVARPAPTHLSYGLSMPMAMGAAAFGTPEAIARTRFGLGRIPLDGAVAARPEHWLRVELELRRGNGWLVGGPANSDVDGRLRRLLIGLTASRGSSGVEAAVDARLDEAAWRGLTVATAAISDPIAAPLIGAAFQTVLATTDAPEAPVSSLAYGLAAIDLLATDANGIVSLSADAFLALRTDPVGYLTARVPAALARPTGWAGLVANEALEGAFTWEPPGSPYGLFVRREGLSGPWRVGIVTSTATTPAETTNLGIDVNIALPAFEPTVELFLNIGAVSFHYRTADGTISLRADPWIDELVLWPTPPINAIAAEFDEALPRMLMSGAVAGVLGEMVPGLNLAMLERLIRTPGAFLMGALGVADGGLDAAKVSALLSLVNESLSLPAGPGLQLPGDVSIVAESGSRPDSARLAVTTTAPIAGVLALAFTLDVDALRHVTPGGTVTISTPLTGTWPQVTITFGVGPDGVTLVVAPQGVEPITLLPRFSGLGALRGAAAALLPAVLDAAVDTFPDPKPLWLQRALAAATHLDVYDAAGKFSAHTPAFAAMLSGTWFDDFDAVRRAGVAAAVVDFVTLVPGLPGTVSSSGGLVRWTLAMPTGTGALDAAAGWGATGAATLQLGLSEVRPASAPLAFSVLASVDEDGLDAALSFGVDLTSIGIATTPRLLVDLTDTARFRVRIAPLGGPLTDGPLIVNLAPAVSVETTAETAEAILVGWVLPLAVEVAVQAATPVLPDRLWTDGPTLEEALTSAGILQAGQVAHPLPSIFQMAAGFLSAASSLLDLPLGDLHLRLVEEDGRIGVGVSGQQSIALGDLELIVVFGAPATWGAAAAEGLLVLLLDTTGGEIAFNFGIRIHGVGIGIEKDDGSALIAETFLRLGSVRAVLFMDIESEPDFQVLHGGGGLRLGGFGLPISAALGAGGGSNPVASNLLGSGGAGQGDSQSVNPAADLDVWYWDHPDNAGGPLRVLVGGQDGIFWIPIHAAFGPIFIDEIGVGLSNTAATLAIGGGVSIAGLTAQVDQLEATIPFAHVTDPSQWSIDLQGLAVGYTGPAITIAGGLVKFDGPPIEYDGMLLVKIGNIGAIVIGSYSVVGSGADEYTSLAIFGGVFVPIGLTPIINLTGLALGLGYNRRLIVPEDLKQIPDFMLVKALDRPEALANNPMDALFDFREQVPPARGALWFAAGLRGTSFEIVHITAVLYVALDRGVDVGLLGVARMALPADDAAVVSIELALKARFSTAEGLFSVQAQLTDNSWLITRECQLTGGFAFFMWFRRSQFLLTIGGYHPSFQPLPEYPVVPRVGYRWNFLGAVQIKGEAYFALTNTAVMTGTRMEATYGPGWIQVWFQAHTDILITWDPFHYEVEIGISVGARLRIRVCFFACCTIRITVSVGATLHLEGPPFHGWVKADLGVTSVTVPFGDDARALPPAKNWDEFVAQYVRSGDVNAGAVSAQVTAGLLPAEPAGAPVAPGTAEQPWRLSAEWALDTATRMPARGFVLQIDQPRAQSEMASAVFGRYDDLDSTYELDLAPMHRAAHEVTSVHRAVIARRPEGGGAFADMVPRTLPPPADATFIIDERLFRVAPTIGQLSEATYHFFPDFTPPAAANTLPALVGLHLDGIGGLHNESEVIPIAKLRDATDFRPLPFARRTPAIVVEVVTTGAAWRTLADVAVGADRARLLGAFATIVTAERSPASQEFAQLRAASGLRGSGYGPVATTALATRRSAPPVLSALSEGFTLEPVDRGVPPPLPPRREVTGVELKEPRLRAVMQHGVVPATVVPTVHTSVVERRAPVVNVERELIRSWPSPGFALILPAAAAAAPETRAARSMRTLRHPALGSTVGRKAAVALEGLAREVQKDGVTLRAGAVQVWELPGSSTTTLRLSGSGAVRVTELSSAGTAIRDREFTVADALELTLAPACAMVAVSALGHSRELARRNRLARPSGKAGALALSAAAGGKTAVAGWQVGSHVAQVGPTTLLGRGSVITLAKPIGSNVRRHIAATGIVALSRATLDQEVVHTQLPATVTVVGVIVDRGTRRDLASADIVIQAEGAQLSGVRQVEAGSRTAFLYDVKADARDAETIAVTVGLRSGLNLEGVFAGFGTTELWANTLAGTTLTQVVPDEPLSGEGELRVRLQIKERRHG